MHNPSFKKWFGELGYQEEVSLERRLKTSKTKKLLEQLGKKKAQQIVASPEAISLLLYPCFCVWHPVKDEEVLQVDFEQTVMKGFKLLKPFNDFLAEVF